MNKFTLLSVTFLFFFGIAMPQHSHAFGGFVQRTTSSAFNRLPDTLSNSMIPFAFKTFSITAVDGINLPGHILLPKNIQQGQKLPAIVFVHSWLFNQIEYLAQELQFVQQGYIVGSYDCRGWYAAEGNITVTGPPEMDDLSRVVDYFIENTPTDPERIGCAGVSYGGGHSLLAPAFEPRIKAVFSMSGWSDLNDALIPNHSGKGLWDLLLVGSASLIANTDVELWKWVSSYLIQDPSKMKETDEALKLRSAITYIDDINQSQTPVFIQNNINDDLFTSGQMINFYSQLTVPKKLTFLNGVHATGEMPGLLFMSSHIWSQAHAWFDYWLKGIDNDIMDQPKIHMYKNWDDQLASFDNVPLNDSTITFFASGNILTTDVSQTPNETYNIEHHLISDTNSGIVMMTPLLYSYLRIPVRQSPSLFGNSKSFDSEAFTSQTMLVGTPEVSLFIKPHSNTFQVNVFLYDVDESGNTVMLTHIPYTDHEATANQVYPLNIKMNLICNMIEQGHKLRMTVSSSDPSYVLTMLEPFSFELLSGTQYPTKIVVPTVKQAIK